jgi:hypothetical protein
MRIRFTASGPLESYRGWHAGQRVCFEPGQTKDIPDAKAEELLRDFPANFSPIMDVTTAEIPAAPVDRMINKSPASKRRGIRNRN